MKKSILYTLLLFIATCTIGGLLNSCRYHSGKEIHIVVLYNTDENDEAYQKWNQFISSELGGQGYCPHLHTVYAHVGINSQSQFQQEVADTVHKLVKEGMRPDLILAAGDLVSVMNSLNPDTLVPTIPTVNFALRTEKFQTDFDSAMHQSLKRQYKYALIFDTLELKHNLELAEILFPDKRNFVSEVDHSFIDNMLRQHLARQMQELDTTHFLDNMDFKYSQSELQRDTLHTSYFTLSFRFPERNVPAADSSATSFSVVWAFYSQRSPFHFIQAKHDFVTLKITSVPDLPPYLTMIAEDFETNDSCIGGYFTPSKALIHDAVETGLQLANSSLQPSVPGTPTLKLYHQKEWLVNWDAYRGGTGCGKVKAHELPPFVKVLNTELIERNPFLGEITQIAIAVVLPTSLIAIFVYFFNVLRTRRVRKKELNRIQQEIVNNNTLAKIAIENTHTIIWEGDTDLFSEKRFALNVFFRSKLTKFLTQNSPGEYTLQCKGSIDGGEEHWFNIYMDVTATDDGISRSGIVTIIDQQKKMEADAFDAQRLLNLAREREGFVASMSHQMRAPLNAIVGFAQVLCQSDVTYSDEEVKEFGGYIEDNNADLTKIINDMLTMSLMENSNMNMQMKTVSIPELMEHYIEWDGVEHIVKRHATKIVIEEGPDVSVSADEKFLLRVMGNLIDNAAKFSEKGSTVTVSWRQTSEEVRISVKDKGIGIAPNQQSLIFERFFKADNFTVGSGLGLTLCRQLLTRMNGSIAVSSTLGQGSTFTITLKKAV